MDVFRDVVHLPGPGSDEPIGKLDSTHILQLDVVLQRGRGGATPYD